MNYPTSIAKEEVQLLPLIRFEGPIQVIDTDEAMHEAIAELRKESILGFDTETKPTFQKGEYNATALIQLANNQTAYLFRVLLLNNTKPLYRFLEEKGIVKVGISIHDDIKDLKKNSSFRPVDFVDLNHIAKEMGITQIGMRSLSGIFLKSRISKSQQTSNWEGKELSPAQQTYAATDAWVCYRMFTELKKQGYIQ